MRHIVLGLLIFLRAPARGQSRRFGLFPLREPRSLPGSASTSASRETTFAGSPALFTLEINGRDQKREIFGTEEFKTYPAPPVGRGATTSSTLNGGVTRRNWSLERPGKYEIKATLTTVDGKKLAATSTIEVETLQPTANRARNVILFVGDGMGPAIRTAARIISKGVEGGRTRGLLEMDQMETQRVGHDFEPRCPGHGFLARSGGMGHGQQEHQ